MHFVQYGSYIRYIHISTSVHTIYWLYCIPLLVCLQNIPMVAMNQIWYVFYSFWYDFHTFVLTVVHTCAYQFLYL